MDGYGRKVRTRSIFSNSKAFRVDFIGSFIKVFFFEKDQNKCFLYLMAGA